MKRPDPSKGFVPCFLTNLALHFWWGVAALVFMILHFWLDVPWIFSRAASAIWGIQSLILTALAYWGNKCGQERDPIKQNKNPYSAKTEDLFPAHKTPAETSSYGEQTDENQ